MNTPITPWINLTLHQAQRCHHLHLAWFLYGWLEREQLLNMEAFVEWWVGGAVAQHMLDAHCDQAVVITEGGMVTGQVQPSQWNALDRPFANAG